MSDTKPCLGCDIPMPRAEWEDEDGAQGVCPVCTEALEAGKKVKNSGGDRYAGRGLRSDPFVF